MQHGSYPPQTIISLPVQTALWWARVKGALSVVIPVQLSVIGLYLPPSFKFKISSAPQTIISVPVQTALWRSRGDGALTRDVDTQLSVLGSYLPPVLNWPLVKLNPPQTIISLPVHTTV
jgi:hypothetical protein